MTTNNYGVPPLTNLRRILDAKGITQAQLIRRSELSYPTVRRAVDGTNRVRASTARKIAKTLGVPQEVLYLNLTPEELARQARYPKITAGHSYNYPETPEENGQVESPEPESEGETLQELREVVSSMSSRLESIEELLFEVASRPIAQFDVQLTERKREDR